MTFGFSKPLGGFALAVLVAALAPLARAEVLGDTTPLKDVTPGGSRIVIKKAYTFSFVEGVSINASWLADCIGSVNDAKFSRGIHVAVDDYLTIDKVGDSSGQVAYDLTVHSKTETDSNNRKFRLLCAHNNFGIVRTSDYGATTVADLRRALDWNVWIEGTTGASNATVAGDAGVKNVASPEGADRSPATVPADKPAR